MSIKKDQHSSSLTASGWESKTRAYPYIICRKVDSYVSYQRLFYPAAGSYLFAEIARRVKAYSAAHPNADIIRLGIGDVTRPLAPAVIEAMHKAVSEMGVQETFHGYGPDYGYDFLVNAIREHDYASRGVQVDSTRCSFPTARSATWATFRSCSAPMR